MTASHNHPPRCCCRHVATISDPDRICPGCPLHGELAALADHECPSCHQLPGRPPTDYCGRPDWHNATPDRTPQPDTRTSLVELLTPTTHHQHGEHHPRTACHPLTCKRLPTLPNTPGQPPAPERFTTPGYDGPEGTEWPRPPRTNPRTTTDDHPR
jgi:hypothetical protein